VRAHVCSCEKRVYPARPCNTARHHFNEDVITDVSALESAMRPWRDTPSRIIGCLINHCAMHAFLPLSSSFSFSRSVFVLREARCIPATHRARSVSIRAAKSLRAILCVASKSSREHRKRKCSRDTRTFPMLYVTGLHAQHLHR